MILGTGGDSMFGELAEGRKLMFIRRSSPAKQGARAAETNHAS